MPVMQRETSIPANAAVENVLSGSAFEFLRGNAVVSAGIVGAAAGLVANMQSGADIVLEESPLAVKTNFPSIPDEMFYNDVGVQGDRLVVRIRNTTGAPIIARTLVQVTPI